MTDHAPSIRLLTGGDLEMSPDLSPHMTGTHPRALLVALILSGGHWVSRDYLAALFHPETGQATARQRLRMTLHNLRRALGPGLDDRLQAAPDQMLLAIDPGEVDVFVFERLAAAGDDRVLGLYGGDLLSQFPEVSEPFDALLRERREALRATALSLATRALGAQALEGDPAAFEAALQRALALDRTDAEAVRTAMRRFARDGQPHRIEEIFERHRRALDEDLSVAPDPETEDLREALLAEARRARDAGSPSEPPPEAGPTPPLSTPAPAPALRWRAPTAAGAALALALGVAAAVFWPDPKPATPVFLLPALTGVAGTCSDRGFAEAYERDVRDAIARIDGAVVVLSGGAVPFDLDAVRVLSLEQTASCAGRVLRATATLIDADTREALWVGRYDVGPGEARDAAARVAADVAAAIAR